VLSVLAGVLGENRISIRQLVQPDAEEGQPVHVVMLTHAAREGDVQKALQRIDAQSSTAAPTLHLRIENPA
jgi:homoserine dehydrogenase